MAKIVDASEFNAFVERREGTDRVKQETYLVRVLKSFVAEHAEHGMKQSDENVLKVLGVTSMKCVYTIANKPRSIYFGMAEELLDNPDRRLDVVRTKIVERIQSTVNQGEKQQEVND